MEHDVRERLLHRAFLYDDPTAFQAGVEATLRELAPILAQTDAPAAEFTPPVPAHATGAARAAG